jgi:hypothetical protein
MSLVISSFDKQLLSSTCINSSCVQSANEIDGVSSGHPLGHHDRAYLFVELINI